MLEPVTPERIDLFALRGGWFMISFSGNSKPKANAGNESVTKLINKIWVGVKNMLFGIIKEVINIPRFTSQEKKEFDNIENVIEDIENKIKCLKEEQTIYSTDYVKLMEIEKEIDELETLLLEKMERWEYLNNINEQIIEYRNNKYK